MLPFLYLFVLLFVLLFVNLDFPNSCVINAQLSNLRNCTTATLILTPPSSTISSLPFFLLRLSVRFCGNVL